MRRENVGRKVESRSTESPATNEAMRFEHPAELLHATRSLTSNACEVLESLRRQAGELAAITDLDGWHWSYEKVDQAWMLPAFEYQLQKHGCIDHPNKYSARSRFDTQMRRPSAPGGNGIEGSGARQSAKFLSRSFSINAWMRLRAPRRRIESMS